MHGDILFFPHASPSPCQAELANKIVKSVLEGKDMVVEAPHGFGKTAAAIVGLPVSPPTLHLKMSMSYISARRGRGNAYSELIMGHAISRVVQAAGRIFGRENQKGIVLLMDER
ncbi:MAG: helicase C-terminal domain-containing protein [Conexivisphaerales archaeon]